MSTPAQTRLCTFAEFLELIPEDQKADLIDGVIYVASPEDTDHNDLLQWLCVVLRTVIRRRQLGRLLIERVAYRLGETTGPEPDLAFVRTDRLALIKKGYVDGPPDLAVEIVSNSSAERDYEDKRRKYEEAGVQEYWIIDPGEEKATFLVRGPTGFTESQLKDHMFHSRILPGFALDVRWLWQTPRPDESPIIQEMLERYAQGDAVREG
jgi:Uma2 family endonuclease